MPVETLGPAELPGAFKSPSPPGVRKTRYLQAQDSNLQAQDSDLQAPDSNLQAQDSNLQAPDSNLQAPDSDLQAQDSNLVRIGLGSYPT